MPKTAYFLNLKNPLTQFILAFSLGCLVGFKIIPVPVVAVLYLCIAAFCIFKCVMGDLNGFFAVLPYLVYNEIYMRAFARWVPYLTVPYVLIICFSILFFTHGRLKRPHSNAMALLIMFTFMEIANNIHPLKPEITRPIITQSFALLMVVVWGSYNVLKPVTINKLLNNIKIAAVYLAGVVFVAHMTGKINYGLFSNADSSNGMAPVQLSGYLGLGCVLLFFSIMNPEELVNRVLNIGVLAITATVMVLTFSRGGLYFLGAEIALFLFFNRAKMGSYAKLIFFVPIGLIIYYYVVNQTGGKIVERYEQEGTSNRDILVDVGFKIFSENMFFGVGTGNYNTVIVKENLFTEESGAHNEYVRAAAEHGIFGIFFYWGFHALLLAEIWNRREPQRQYSIYFLLLFFLIIIHNGLKIGIQPLLIMLAVATPTLARKKPQNVYRRELAETRLA